MQTYHLQLQQSSKLILALVFIPIIAVGAFLAVMIRFPNLSEWLVATLISIFLILLIVLILWIIKKLLIATCEVTMNNEGISYKLDQPSFFYRSRFSSTWNNVRNISITDDMSYGRRFFQISFKQPSFTITFCADPDCNDDTDNCYAEILAYKEAFYTANQQQITSKGFYDSWWAKGITWLLYAGITAIIVAAFYAPDQLNWVRLFSFFCFGGIWLVNYHANRRKN